MIYKEYQKKYREEHKEEMSNYQKLYYLKYKEEKDKKSSENYYKNKEQYKERSKRNHKLLRKINIQYRIKDNLSRRLRRALKGNFKSFSTMKLVGCSIKFLKEHLEKQFKQGMAWDNYGLWHIDHKRPCASFDLSISEEQAKCFNWHNLQPLWAKENLEKKDKILN